MRQTPAIFLLILCAGVIAGCGSTDDTAETPAADVVEVPSTAPAVSFTPEGDGQGAAGGPVTIEYRIIGEPVVDQPVAVELRFVSSLGEQALTVAYRINDASALQLADSQPASLMVAPVADGGGAVQRVTVVPLREGRIYLNVSASVESADGSIGTATAIPIQVGNALRSGQPDATAGNDEIDDASSALPDDEE